MAQHRKAWEENGFGRLLSRYADTRDYLARLTGSAHVAEDLVQDTYMRALRRYEARGPPHDSHAWLKTIAKNVAREYLSHRKASVDVNEYESILASDAPGPIEPLIDAEEAANVRARVAELPSPARGLIEGFYFQGKGCGQLAAETGIDYANVKMKMYRARRKMRRELEEE